MAWLDRHAQKSGVPNQAAASRPPARPSAFQGRAYRWGRGTKASRKAPSQSTSQIHGVAHARASHRVSQTTANVASRPTACGAAGVMACAEPCSKASPALIRVPRV